MLALQRERRVRNAGEIDTLHPDALNPLRNAIHTGDVGVVAAVDRDARGHRWCRDRSADVRRAGECGSIGGDPDERGVCRGTRGRRRKVQRFRFHRDDGVPGGIDGDRHARIVEAAAELSDEQERRRRGVCIQLPDERVPVSGDPAQGSRPSGHERVAAAVDGDAGGRVSSRAADVGAEDGVSAGGIELHEKAVALPVAAPRLRSGSHGHVSGERASGHVRVAVPVDGDACRIGRAVRAEERRVNERRAGAVELHEKTVVVREPNHTLKTAARRREVVRLGVSGHIRLAAGVNRDTERFVVAGAAQVRHVVERCPRGVDLRDERVRWRVAGAAAEGCLVGAGAGRKVGRSRRAGDVRSAGRVHGDCTPGVVSAAPDVRRVHEGRVDDERQRGIVRAEREADVGAAQGEADVDRYRCARRRADRRSARHRPSCCRLRRSSVRLRS